MLKISCDIRDALLSKNKINNKIELNVKIDKKISRQFKNDNKI